jgi:hypothetical protein
MPKVLFLLQILVMKIINVVYWVSTVLICFLMGFSAYNDLVNNPDFVATMNRLGYPPYLMPFLGVVKFIAIAIIIIPFNGRLKDWAYAGIVIDLVGAAYSHYKVDGISDTVLPLVAVIITLVSYFLYLKRINNFL